MLAGLAINKPEFYYKKSLCHYYYKILFALGVRIFTTLSFKRYLVNLRGMNILKKYDIILPNPKYRALQNILRRTLHQTRQISS